MRTAAAALVALVASLAFAAPAAGRDARDMQVVERLWSERIGSGGECHARARGDLVVDKYGIRYLRVTYRQAKCFGAPQYREVFYFQQS